MWMRAAAIQLNSTDDRDRNLEVAEKLVRDAAAGGAELVGLPEKWTFLGPPEGIAEAAEPLSGPSMGAASDWAAELGIHLLAGSFPERLAGHEKPFNTSVMFGPDGAVESVYRKLHMFDVDVGGVAYRESEAEDPGDEIVVTNVDGLPVGLSVCYDLRFPELYRIMAVRGARLITVPAAFTERTGRDHWEVLLRARAIENQAFVLAPNQIGEAPPHYRSYGHSMIVDPWGLVIARAPDTEGFVIADLDLGALDDIRDKLPSLRNRRPDAYRWPEETAEEPSAKAESPNGPAGIAEPANPSGAP
ncbi:MAG: Nitrilase/cyanide hydratase and apolipoprotein N-acyltransferase [Solirubrobacterales bacterium]|jgi:predicted amidohydrolase|nr:Nitrilase/cyanide hydratase and apolipoprotein N-acyltransferase [Solirubrobacterales bacterium]